MAKPQDTSDRTLVFVYGTLMIGHRNHCLLDHDGASFLGHSATLRPATLVDVHGGAFPALTSVDGGPCRVVGQIFAVDDQTLIDLDRLEGVPHLYRRETIDVMTSNGKEAQAIAYVWNAEREPGPVIACGCWETHERTGDAVCRS